MTSRDVRTTTAGELFIAATATSLVATAFLGSLLKEPGFLATVALHQDRLLTAALFQLLAASPARPSRSRCTRCCGSMPPGWRSEQSPSGSSRACSTPYQRQAH